MTTAEQTSTKSLEAARAVLRLEQSEALRGQGPALPGQPVTGKALERFRELTRTVPDGPTGRWRRGPFTYVPELEAERIARGEALIRRVDPGPHEDANFFAMLAYQAASIELVQQDIAPVEFSTFLLGTAHAAEVNAFSQRLPAGHYTVVVLNSGLVDFVYQSAKVVVEAMHPVRTTGAERGLVKASTDLDVIRAGLAMNQAPIERLYLTLEAYFFHGYPRATAFETVPDEQHPPLSLVVSLAERWIIGHEYGHGVAPAMTELPAGMNPSWAEEYFADVSSMVATVASAKKLDAVAPEFSLGGAIFALACLDLRQRALYLLLTGDEHPPAGESTTHPANCDRATSLIDQFRHFFDIDYHPDHTSDLWLRPKAEVPRTHGFTADRAAAAYTYANILQAVWVPVRDRVAADYRSQRPLHPMWQ